LAFAKVDASSWVTSWQGSRFVGDADGVGDAGAEADGVGVGVGDAGADDDAGAELAGGCSGIGVTGALDDAGGAVVTVGVATAVTDS
jgi:hypothetical protein